MGSTILMPWLATLIEGSGWHAACWAMGLLVLLPLGHGSGLSAWYAVQVHQTKYLVEIRLNVEEAGWALGLVSLVAIPGQISAGASRSSSWPSRNS